MCVCLDQTQALWGKHTGRLSFFLLAVGRLLATMQFPGRGGDSEEGLGAKC